MPFKFGNYPYYTTEWYGEAGTYDDVAMDKSQLKPFSYYLAAKKNKAEASASVDLDSKSKASNSKVASSPGNSNFQAVPTSKVNKRGRLKKVKTAENQPLDLTISKASNACDERSNLRQPIKRPRKDRNVLNQICSNQPLDLRTVSKTRETQSSFNLQSSGLTTSNASDENLNVQTKARTSYKKKSPRKTKAASDQSFDLKSLLESSIAPDGNSNYQPAKTNEKNIFKEANTTSNQICSYQSLNLESLIVSLLESDTNLNSQAAVAVPTRNEKIWPKEAKTAVSNQISSYKSSDSKSVLEASSSSDKNLNFQAAVLKSNKKKRLRETETASNQIRKNQTSSLKSVLEASNTSYENTNFQAAADAETNEKKRYTKATNSSNQNRKNQSSSLKSVSKASNASDGNTNFQAAAKTNEKKRYTEATTFSNQIRTNQSSNMKSVSEAVNGCDVNSNFQTDVAIPTSNKKIVSEEANTALSEVPDGIILASQVYKFDSLYTQNKSSPYENITGLRDEIYNFYESRNQSNTPENHDYILPHAAPRPARKRPANRQRILWLVDKKNKSPSCLHRLPVRPGPAYKRVTTKHSDIFWIRKYF